MKKIAITVFAFALATCGFAQKKNVSGAENKLYEPMDLDGAKTLIEAAMQDSITSKQAKTYWVAAEVYEKIYEQQDINRQLNKPFDQSLVNEVLIKAVNAYKKTSELDNLPDEKGKIKQKYGKMIPGKLENYKNYLINAGLANYQIGQYPESVELWSKYIEMADYAIMGKSNLKADTMYNEMKYYTIDAALKSESTKSIAIKYMEDLKSTEKYGQTMYEWLYSTYNDQKNDKKVISTLKEAINKYPSNEFFIGNLINYYLENNKDNEALAYVDEGISKNPNNVQYYLLKTQFYLKKSNFDKAVEVSKQAISIDSNNFDANYYCGLSYVKKAESMLDKASKIKDNTKYKAAQKLGNDQFKNAIPYLEKARSLDPKHELNLTLLKTSYYRSGNGEKATEIENEIKKLK